MEKVSCDSSKHSKEFAPSTRRGRQGLAQTPEATSIGRDEGDMGLHDLTRKQPRLVCQSQKHPFNKVPEDNLQGFAWRTNQNNSNLTQPYYSVLLHNLTAHSYYTTSQQNLTYKPYTTLLHNPTQLYYTTLQHNPTTQPYYTTLHIQAAHTHSKTLHSLPTQPHRTTMRQSRMHVPMGPCGDSVCGVGAAVIRAPCD